MSSWKKSKYLKNLKKIYINEKLKKTSSGYYKNWINHKYKHSIGVMKCAIELIEKESKLKALPDNIKAQMIDSALLHDAGRAFEVDWQTGKILTMDHGVEGARAVFNLGEYSFLTMIAVWVHNKVDESYLLMNNKDFEKTDYFKNLNNENKVFVKVLRKNFKSLPKKEQEIVLMTAGLVKDADKVDNFLHFKEMSTIGGLDSAPKLSRKAFKQLLDGELVREYKTFLDQMFGIMAWTNDLRFQTSLDWVKKENSLKKMKAFCLKQYKKESPETLNKITRDFDKAIEFLSSKY